MGDAGMHMGLFWGVLIFAGVVLLALFGSRSGNAVDDMAESTLRNEARNINNGN